MITFILCTKLNSRHIVTTAGPLGSGATCVGALLKPLEGVQDEGFGPRHSVSFCHPSETEKVKEEVDESR